MLALALVVHLVQQLVEHLVEQGKCSCELHLSLSQKNILIKVVRLKVTLPKGWMMDESLPKCW